MHAHPRARCILALLLTGVLASAGCTREVPTPTPTAPAEALDGGAPGDHQDEALGAASRPVVPPDPAAGGPLATLAEACDRYTGTPVRAVTTVAVVTDAADTPLEAPVLQGVRAAVNCLGLRAVEVTSAGPAPDGDADGTAIDAVAEAVRAVASGPAVVVTIGGHLGPATLEAALAAPDVAFIGIEQPQTSYPENYVGVLHRTDEAGVLAGAVGALLSEFGILGVIGGAEALPAIRFLEGAVRGAALIDTGVRVVGVDTGTLDPLDGSYTAQQLLGEGADVLISAGGPGPSAGIRTASAAGARVVVAGAEAWEVGRLAGGAPEVAAAVVPRVDLGTFVQIGELLTGRFGGGVFWLDAANGGITVTGAAGLPADVVERIEAVRAGLADATIDPGSTR
ncbi:hypothetical protein BH23ACT9_BH23ACT9_00850 [soil metagenome]